MAVSATPSEASQLFRRPVVGSTGSPATRSASRKRHTWKALPPKMSPIASALSPSRTAAMPELISGRAVTVASTVAPKITPPTPALLASVSPLSSSPTPATSVTAQAAANTPAT